ncbi:MAG TPA: hypothetical protein VNN10_15680 [Dehalococcoidia bacterium]|nr:hypothetical protein [Dehalococcoidia bacterium]
MVRRGLRAGAGALVLVLSALVLACGGASTAGTKGGLQLTPVGGDATQAAVGAANAAWVEWKENAGKFLDRDFFDCYELNGVPRPPNTPVPDPSGHSRARRGCDEALAAIEKALPDYRRFVADLEKAKVDAASPFKPQFDMVVKARKDRLEWATASVAAWKRNDRDALQTLRLQIPQLATQEAAALGVVFTGATPEPRPTLDFIPGVPTRTPAPSR